MLESDVLLIPIVGTLFANLSYLSKPARAIKQLLKDEKIRNSKKLSLEGRLGQVYYGINESMRAAYCQLWKYAVGNFMRDAKKDLASFARFAAGVGCNTNEISVLLKADPDQIKATGFLRSFGIPHERDVQEAVAVLGRLRRPVDTLQPLFCETALDIPQVKRAGEGLEALGKVKFTGRFLEPDKDGITIVYIILATFMAFFGSLPAQPEPTDVQPNL